MRNTKVIEALSLPISHTMGSVLVECSPEARCMKYYTLPKQQPFSYIPTHLYLLLLNHFILIFHSSYLL